MQASIQAIRAITFVTFRRIFLPIIWVGAGILVMLWVVAILAITVEISWLWVFVVLIPLSLVAAAIGSVVWLAALRIAPRKLNHADRSQLTEFTDKIFALAEVRATPWPLIVAFIAKDIVRGKKSSYIEGIIQDSKSLKSDFVAIRQLFEK